MHYNFIKKGGCIYQGTGLCVVVVVVGKVRVRVIGGGVGGGG